MGKGKLGPIALLVAMLMLVVQPAQVTQAASLTVNSTADAVDASPGDGLCDDGAGNCTLRAAIMEANALLGPDAITLPALGATTTVYALTITGANEDASATGDLDITDDLTINGAGAATTIIDGGALGFGRVLQVFLGSTVEVSDVTIRNGNGGGLFAGGGIQNGGTLTLTNVAVIDNTGAIGGGIHNSGALSVISSTVSGNTAIGGGGGVGGGGIANDGLAVLTLTGTTVSGNTTNRGNGGGLHSKGTLTMVASTVSGNIADSFGGGVFLSSAIVMIAQSIVDKNTAAHGGGISIERSVAVSVTDSEISENHARISGGGIHNTGALNRTVALTNTVISGNTAAHGGGISNCCRGLFTLDDSTVGANNASIAGGGIHNSSQGGFVITGSTVRENSASDGGGLWNSSFGAGPSLTLTNSTVTGNSANSNGGGFFSSGFSTNDPAKLTLTNSTVSDNVAPNGAGIHNGSISRLTLTSTIVANNFGDDCVDSGVLASFGHNLDSDGTCGLPEPTDISNIDPALGVLADNGGPTLTHALLPDSPAINAVPVADCTDPDGNPLTTDQRGITRPQGSACDIGAFELVPPPDTFVVNNSDDVDDGICDAGHCSLREAIKAANTHLARDMIVFDIPGAGPHAIQPSSSLPTISDPVIIDGYTQPGASPNANGFGFGGNTVLKVVLDGINAGAFADGLTISAGGSTLRGLAVNRFDGFGILMEDNGGNVIEGNYIGTDANGVAALPNGDNGIFILNSADNTIGGSTPEARNVISGNGFHGISIAGPSATGNLVQGNFIGTDATGLLALGNAATGVGIFDTTGNMIGGTVASEGNLISGNTFDGVLIFQTPPTAGQGQAAVTGSSSSDYPDIDTSSSDAAPVSASRRSVPLSDDGSVTTVLGGEVATVVPQAQDVTPNVVQGNLIGTDVDGENAVPNGSDGVHINGSPSNVVGGTTPGAGNVISGNGDDGVDIRNAGATANLVQGNLIGTTISGSVPIPNADRGIVIVGAPGNLIGGTTGVEANVISGNQSDGVIIQGSDATGNSVLGNLIGLDISGGSDLGNLSDGIVIFQARNNVIGDNTISGNEGEGVVIFGDGSTGNKVQGNYIGTDVTGAADLGNSFSGVRILGGASSNTIGGLAAGLRNIVSGNDSAGVFISGTSTTANLVQGNFIGTDVTGAVDLGNSSDGVFIAGAPNNTVGGTQGITPGGPCTGACNLVSGNDEDGVELNGALAAGNVLRGNFIGTDVTGTLDLGNAGDGVEIEGAPNNIIGGTTAEARNLVSGNDAGGVAIIGVGATGNQIQGNLIGTDGNGAFGLGNSLDGVFILDASANTIGGSASSTANLIAFNGAAGIRVRATDAPSTGNAILSNSIFSNTGLGIDLAPNGVTPNDIGDGDTGPNNLQNFPQLTSAVSGITTIGDTTIEGTLSTTPSATFRLEFFSNSYCDPSAHGEGEVLLGFTDATTDGLGHASFTVTFPVAVADGRFIAATATDASNNTSEYSACVAVEPQVVVVAPVGPDIVLLDTAFDTSIQADDVSDLGSAHLMLSFDQSLLTFIGAQPGADVATCGSSVDSSTVGNLVLGLACTTGRSGAPLRLWTLTFMSAHVENASSTHVTVTEAQLMDTQNPPQSIAAEGSSHQLTVVPRVCGNLNGDGLINVFDAIISLQIIVGLIEPAQAQMILGDVVRDGTINVFDVILTLQHIVGLTQITECGPAAL